MKNIKKHLILFVCGGIAYVITEVLFRGYSHISMFILGGIVFVEIGLINELFDYNLSLILQGLIGSVLITVSELFAGLILNIWLKLNVWDYTDMPFNLMGQICLPYSVIWVFVAIVAVILDDYLRYKLFKEKFPVYHIF